MKNLFCWRCRAEVPMLDETEYQVIRRLFGECMRATKEFRQQHNLPLDACSIDERFAPVGDKYREMTGYEATVANAVMHHRIVLYGAPCTRCGKPLRTPEARFCAECGEKVV